MCPQGIKILSCVHMGWWQGQSSDTSSVNGGSWRKRLIPKIKKLKILKPKQNKDKN